MSKTSLRYYIKKYRFNSVFLRNLIMIILISTIPFGTSCFLVYQRAMTAMKTETEMVEQKKMEKMTDAVDHFTRSMDRLCVVLLQQEDVRRVFVKNSSVRLSECYMNMMNNMNLFTLSYNYIRNVKVYSESNNVIISQVAVTKADNDTGGVLDCYQKAGDGLYISAVNANGAGIQTVMFMRKKNIGNETLGAVCIEVNIDRLFEELGIAYNDPFDRIMMTDSSGKVLLSSYLDDIHRTESDLRAECKEKNFKITKADAGDGRSYVHVYNDTYYDETRRRMAGLIGVMIFFSLFMVGLFAVYISKQSFQPLAIILEYFDKDENKSTAERNELSYIMHGISSLESENSNLTEEVRERMVRMNKAQLHALQNQINPHFMYNTLETIKWMAMDMENDEEAKVSSMIEMLSDIIGYSLDMEQYLVGLDEEIKNTETYICIMQIRHENKFAVEWNVDPALRGARVLKLCIQPLIENAMLHGFAPNQSEGKIRISVKQIKHDLCIEVEDNGVGIESEKLEELCRSLDEAHEPERGKHIGLHNVNLRVRLVFGDEYGVSVFSEKGKGTRVVLRMEDRRKFREEKNTIVSDGENEV